MGGARIDINACGQLAPPYWLHYFGGTAGFSPGETVTGARSGASGMIAGVNGSVTAGTLWLDPVTVSGAFLPGERITSAGGNALVNYPFTLHGLTTFDSSLAAVIGILKSVVADATTAAALVGAREGVNGVPGDDGDDVDALAQAGDMLDYNNDGFVDEVPADFTDDLTEFAPEWPWGDGRRQTIRRIQPARPVLGHQSGQQGCRPSQIHRPGLSIRLTAGP